MWKSTWDSSCTALACIAFCLSIVILIIYYGFSDIRILTSWDKSLIDSVNNLITSACSGYIVTYIFYILTILIPHATKMQYKRVGLEEKARRLKDALYDFLNTLCEFCSDQTEIVDYNWEVFRKRNCYGDYGTEKSHYQLKQDCKNLLKDKSTCISNSLKSVEEELEYLYKTECSILFLLKFAPMWQSLEQISSNAIFSSDEYKKFLEQAFAFYQLSIILQNQLQDKRIIKLMKHYDIPLQGSNNKVCSFISIINFNKK